ncbi:glycoside hydrolase family 78 protein [Pleomassaria siparia CBS 279.74]|uniref:alpha-L-rhamnosidase n=1 Tax=Pleomassaria siparia CBS 279.74 TaxID=1314801 RepID=A0A6G1JTE5_9PLEO|nr:glycoside hydrolase family 78 protein [Pleomassaria siparia CBS 279.74]
MSISLCHLSFEHHRPAFGIAETEPRISWKFCGDAIDWEQTAYDVEITRGPDGVPNVFKINSTDSILIPWPDKPLASAESATVRARAHGKEGQPSSDWSDSYPVETSILVADDWAGAVTIAADRPTEVDGPKQPVMFRKAFSAGEVASARLYITALGLYEAEINGQRVGDHVLAPGYQAYNYRHVFDTYDVTDLVKAGDNAIGVTVGEGWFSGRFGFGARPRNLYGDTLGLLALLVTTDNDGNKQTVISDATWKTSTGPIITSEIYNGEMYNASLRQEGWSSAGFDESAWLATKTTNFSQAGRPSPPDGPPIKRHEEIMPKEIVQSTSGKTVLDFGQNLVGWLRLTVDGPDGTVITMVHTEVMENGEVSTRPLRSAKATDTLTLDGTGPITWEPKFTYHGFRYVQITGWPAETPLDGNSVTALVVHSDMERSGFFETSNKDLNKFHDNVIWSMKGNFLGVPTDCPQRDERLGWTGDAHAFMPTANYLYDTAGFWRGWLKDGWSEQSRGDYFVPPFYIPSDDIEDTDRGRVRQPTAVWGDIVVGNPWALYQTTGDKVMLKEQLQGAKMWIDKGIPRRENGLWKVGIQFGDWLDPKAPPEDARRATTDGTLVADAYLIQMTHLLSQMNEALGDADQQEIYRVQHDDVLIPAFQAAWMAPYADAGGIANVTQTALALALRFGIYTTPESREAASKTLRKIIQDNQFQVGTGFAGTQQLGFALTETGSTPHFYKMLLSTTVPSWLYSVSMGATTTWERWDSLMPDGTVNPGSMTSFNHYAFGSVADWMHQKIGGLAPGVPGWKTIRVAPEPGGGITSARSAYRSAYGWANVTWEVTDDNKFSMTVKVPPNARAQVVLPGGTEVYEVGSGESSFEIDGFVLPV